MASSAPNPSNCSICLETFNSPAACVPCGHVFCHLCISQWYSNNGGARQMCPQCRTVILSIQSLRIDDGNIYIHHSSVLDRVSSFFYRQWFSLSRLALEVADEIPTNWNELDDLAGRHGFPNPRLAVQRVRRLPDAILMSVANLGIELQILTLLISILILSLFVKDFQNPSGLFHSCLFPVLSVCQEIFREILCCLLLLICRPLVCVGQCILEVTFALWDIFLGVGTCTANIGVGVVTIPQIVINAALEWLRLLVVFISETFIAAFRLGFLLCLVLVPGFLSQTTEEQRNAYFQTFLGVVESLWNRYHDSIARLQEQYHNR